MKSDVMQTDELFRRSYLEKISFCSWETFLFVAYVKSSPGDKKIDERNR